MTDSSPTPNGSAPAGLRARLGLSAPAIVLLVLVFVLAVVGAWLIGLDYGIAIGLAIVVSAITLGIQWLRSRRRGSTGTLAFVGSLVAGTVVTLGMLNLVPGTRSISNPPVTGEPAWNSARTEELVRAACYDCHSNETVKPWYANVAPMSLALGEHVEDGREELNFSEWGSADSEEGADDVIEVVREGSMPPASYTRFGLHSGADLSAAQTDELIAGLEASGFPDEHEGGDGEGGERYDDGDDDSD